MRTTACSEKGDQVKGGCMNTNFRFESKVMCSISKYILHKSCLYMILTVMWLSGYCAVENVAVIQDSVSGKYDHLVF